MKGALCRTDMRVVYIPNHANGDREHTDCERGKITSWRGEGEDATVFVRFDGDTNPKACYAWNLEPEL